MVTDEPAAMTVRAPDGSLSDAPVTASTWFADLAVGPGARVALLGDDELLLWDRGSGEESRLEVDHGVGGMCWSADEQELFCLSETEGVMAWDGSRWRMFDLP